MVDTLGLILVVVVHAADVQDRDGAKIVLRAIKSCLFRLRTIWADGGYAGTLLGWVERLRPRCKIRLEIIKRNDSLAGFVLLPKRWVVERTFGWLGRYRRHSKDYEQLPASSEAMIYISMINLMSARLARSTSC